MKNFKTFYKSKRQSVLYKEIILPPTDKGCLRFRHKNFWTEIYLHKHLFSKCSENAVLGLLEMVQYKWFLWHQPGIWFWLREYIFHHIEWAEVRKMSEAFYQKLWAFLSENLKLVDMRFLIIGRYETPNMRFLFIYFLVQISV